MLITSSRDRFSNRHTPWILAAITIFSALLRAIHIGQASLSNDELFSRYYSEAGLHFLWTQGFKLETTPPTYYTLLLGWMHLFGSGETALRSLSLVASVATVPLVYLLAQEFVDRQTALLAALLFALSPMQIYYAQEARAYTLMLLPIAVALVGMARFLREPRSAHLVFYVLGAAVSMYVHSTSVLIIAAFNAAFLIILIRQKALGWTALLRWAVANALVVLLSVPELLATLQQVHGDRLSWMPPVSGHDVAVSIGAFITGPVTYPRKLSIYLALIFCVAIAVSTYMIRGNWRIVTILIVVPLCDFALILLAGVRQPILVPRILCWMGLPFSILPACVLTTPHRTRPAFAILTTILLFTGLVSQFNQNAKAKEPWRLLFAQLQPKLDQADLVVVGPWTQPSGFLYYGQDMTKVRHWAEPFPETIESTVIARMIGAQNISRADLLNKIRQGHGVLLVQRAVDYPFQNLLTDVYPDYKRTQQDCDGFECITVLYWGGPTVQ